MDCMNVSGQVRFLFETFVTVCIIAGKKWSVGRMKGVDVPGKAAFRCEAARTKGAWEGEGRVCVFDEQVVCHGLLSFGGPLAQAAQERGRRAD